jgi:hypothetical protein
MESRAFIPRRLGAEVLRRASVVAVNCYVRIASRGFGRLESGGFLSNPEEVLSQHLAGF